MADLGKLLILAGGFLLLVGIVLVLSGRMHVPIGRLPGDIVYRGKNTTFYFPIVTSIALSVVLSLVMYLVGRFRH
jgi:predicted tellurium resistance membrane protein TerC